MNKIDYNYTFTTSSNKTLTVKNKKKNTIWKTLKDLTNKKFDNEQKLNIFIACIKHDVN